MMQTNPDPVVTPVFCYILHWTGHCAAHNLNKALNTLMATFTYVSRRTASTATWDPISHATGVWRGFAD